jgi:hypothetical protein
MRSARTGQPAHNDQNRASVGIFHETIMSDEWRVNEGAVQPFRFAHVSLKGHARYACLRR